MLTLAFPKGRLGEEAEKLFIKAGLMKKKIPADSRKLIFDTFNDIRILLVRAQDVATYVENGAADVGVAGKDILLEQGSDVLELLDLEIGHCRMVVAGMKDKDRQKLFANSFLKVGTKYPNISKKFFSNISIQSEIIKLYGSVELAALTRMTDCIVDIVSTGKTLSDNGMVIIEELFESTARLICNRSIYYRNLKALQNLVDRLSSVIQTNTVE